VVTLRCEMQNNLFKFQFSDTNNSNKAAVSNFELGAALAPT